MATIVIKQVSWDISVIVMSTFTEGLPISFRAVLISVKLIKQISHLGHRTWEQILASNLVGHTVDK